MVIHPSCIGNWKGWIEFIRLLIRSLGNRENSIVLWKKCKEETKNNQRWKEEIELT